MAFIKRADATLTGVFAPTKKMSAVKAADHIDVDDIPADFTFDDRYVYSISRAISSRSNLNSDGFPKGELLGEINDLPAGNPHYGYSTFKAARVHLDHFNNPQMAAQDIRNEPRGKIVWSWYVEDPMGDIPQVKGVEDPVYKEAGSDAWIKTLMATDKNRFPLLGESIESGLVNKVSMGCEIINSECSVCGKTARNEMEYCKHSQLGSRGNVFAAQEGSPYVKSGTIAVGDPMFAHEKNHGLQFFELSWILDVQADPTAVSLDRIEGEGGSSLKDLLLHRDGSPSLTVTSQMKETIEKAARTQQTKKALGEEGKVEDDAHRKGVNLKIENPEALEDDEGDEAEPSDSTFDHDRPPSEQPGEHFPTVPFPCSAISSADEANEDLNMDTTINIEKCLGCMYNRSNVSGGVDCSFPEVVRAGGSDPLPPGFDDPGASDDSSDDDATFMNEDGSDIEDFPGLERPPNPEKESSYEKESALKVSPFEISDARWE